MNPKVTVITVVKDSEYLIEKTIVSVKKQDYENLEYIIIDGDSQDNTKSVIQAYTNSIDKFISEPDHGLYDAMNKAAQLASGDWIIYMNAGDCFYASNSISRLATVLKSDADAILAGVEEVLVDKLEIRRFHKMPRPITDIWKAMPTSHQAIVIRLSCQKAYPYNTEYCWCADHDMLARMYRDGKKFVSVNSLLSIFDCNSSQRRDPTLFIRERWQLSRGLAPFPHRLMNYGFEWLHCTIWGKIVNFIKFFLPSSTILYLRRVRGTVGN